MKNLIFNRVTLLFLISFLLGACGSTPSSGDESSFSRSSYEQASEGSTVSSNEHNSDSAETRQPKTSFGEELSYELSKPSYTTPSEDYILQSQTASPCNSHDLSQIEIIKEATIISKGVKRYTCPNCGAFMEKWYYDLDECVFEDATYAFDGHERQLLIRGMLPLGVSVKYEDNKLTQVGSIEAKATFYDENNEQLGVKTAKLTIVDNYGYPNIRVDTETKEDPNYKEKTNYTTMRLSIDNAEQKYCKSNLTGGIRVRGNSTNQAGVTKRAWRLKFDSKVNMLGLNYGKKYKSWVLMADYFDQSMFRNASAWFMGQQLFKYSNNHSSAFQHVNLYMNGEYRGIYLLGEQQQCKDGRINILEAEDDPSVNVGYLVELDGLVTQGNSDEEYTFTISSGSSGGQGGWGGFGGNSKGYAIKTDVFSQDQADYIEKYVKNVFKILENAVSSTPKLQTLDANHDLIDSPYDNQYDTLNAVIDLDSLFKMYVLQELMKNYDVGWGSFYLFVDFSKTSVHPRLTFGAPWDFDWSSGNASASGMGWGGGGSSSSSGFINQTSGTFINNSQANNSMTFFNPWLADLGKTDFFNEMIKKYYTVFAQSDIYEGVYQFVSYETCAFADEFKANYDKWGTLNGTEVTMYTRQDIVKNYQIHKDAVKFYLDWLSERKTYMDNTYLLN